MPRHKVQHCAKHCMQSIIILCSTCYAITRNIWPSHYATRAQNWKKSLRLKTSSSLGPYRQGLGPRFSVQTARSVNNQFILNRAMPRERCRTRLRSSQVALHAMVRSNFSGRYAVQLACCVQYFTVYRLLWYILPETVVKKKNTHPVFSAISPSALHVSSFSSR